MTALDGQLDGSFPLDVVVIEYGARFFLGQCLAALGDHRGAIASMEMAARLSPERTEAAAALRELQPSRAGKVLPRMPVVAHRPGQQETEEYHPSARLTLCMIVRNEEARLGACLDSVVGLVDEIVVVDTGSTDSTVDVARQYGAVMGAFEWCDDFAAARNESLRLATGDWIMWLDADDVLPAEYHAPIRKLVSGSQDRGYFFVLDDQGYESVSCLQMRLFPNVEGIEFEMPIHEQVTPSLGRLGIDMQPTDIRVVHTGYTAPDVVREKKDRYLGIIERWLRTHPGDYIVRSHACLTYHTTGRFDEAVAGYRYIIEQTNCLADHNYVVYTTSLLFLGRTYLKMGRVEDAMEWIGKAHEFDADYVLSRFSMAEVNLAAGNWEQAAQAARSVITGDMQLTFFPIDQQELTYSSLCVLGRALAQLDDLDGAAEALRRASESGVQRRSEALGILSEIYKAKGRPDEAYQVLSRALALSPQDPKHRFNRGMLDLEANRLEAAATAFNSVLEVSPDYAPALMNLGFIAKSSGDFEGAQGWYSKVLAADADNTDGHANLAHLFLGQERFAEAEVHFARVQADKPDLLDIQLGLLLACMAQGTWNAALARLVLGALPESAATDLSSALSAAPAFLKLGVSLIHRQVLSCAQIAFSCAVMGGQQDPRGAPVVTQARRCLGELHTTLGQSWKAVEQYESLLKANPNDGEAFQRLGDCYTRLGVEDAARMCYERSRQLGAV
ncbi:MAG: tetratricopeptide repeat protein [Gemmatimonadetes bacterium]|nr:tetratricopeptide repeat protein [Gemmatimonadota bacterium]